MFSGGRERVHLEQMGSNSLDSKITAFESTETAAQIDFVVVVLLSASLTVRHIWQQYLQEWIGKLF